MLKVMRSPTAFAEVIFPAMFGETLLFVPPLASEAATTATATQPIRARAIGIQYFRVRLISLSSFSSTYDGCNYPTLISRRHSPTLLSRIGLDPATTTSASGRKFGSFGSFGDAVEDSGSPEIFRSRSQLSRVTSGGTGKQRCPAADGPTTLPAG
jgi:hypothetical protein